MYEKLEEMGFFAYHGDGNGDHFRKHGLSGWKLVTAWGWAMIKKKTPNGLRDWTTYYKIENNERPGLTGKQEEKFLDKVRELVKNGEIEDTL